MAKSFRIFLLLCTFLTPIVSRSEPQNVESFTYNDHSSKMQIQGSRYILAQFFKGKETSNQDSFYAYCEEGDQVVSGGCSADFSSRSISRSAPNFKMVVETSGPRKDRWKLGPQNLPMYSQEGWMCSFTQSLKEEKDAVLNVFVICSNKK